VQELWQSARFVDLAIALTGVEWVALLVLRRTRGRGLAPGAIAGQLLAGLMLLLALRCVLVGADYRWTLLLFSASLPAHVFDLVKRARAA
jgi:hypothetical protein